ncbi:MAG: polysaccharide biosynthesis protein [Candidatus Nealsonbacteria bacterium]|nr:polysaccharide biosynthesis protein [Candidatus Nealsonbacteria bacterium]
MSQVRLNKQDGPGSNGRAGNSSFGLSSGATSADTNGNSAHSFPVRIGRLILRIGNRLTARRVWLLAAAHAAFFAMVYLLAFGLRFDFQVDADAMDLFWKSLPWIVGVKLTVFFLLGHFDGWWSYVTFSDLVAMARGFIVSLFVIVAIDHFLLDARFLGPAYEMQIPRVVLVLDSVFSFVLLGGLQASWRLFREQFRPILRQDDNRWALLVGADLRSGILAHQIHSNFQLPYRIKGCLAVDGKNTRSRLGQISVLGRVEDIREIAAAYQATDVLVTSGMLSGKRMRKLMDACQESHLNLKIIRPEEDRFHGDHHVPMRDIEINDLLGRDPIVLDTQSIDKLLEGRRVIVTGAGGSIGSEICRQVLKFNPESLMLVGRGENRIFEIDNELRQLETSTELHTAIGDVTVSQRMHQIFEQYRPEVVFHAAAHKHVPLMELNVGEAIKNNVCGTKCLADLADEFGVRNFVFISTDKAVHPTSVMGVSKQIAERYIHTISQESSTKYMVVRFGNVLGSAGSVVPVFQKQIRRGGPITVTDPRMTRFFMTIPEASQLVLQAAAMGSGGEIFVLEMGEPVRIVDLAHDLIRLSGLPEHAIEISYTGMRPGEKLFEELYFDEEQTLPTAHSKLRAAYHRPYALSEVRRVIEELEQLIHAPEQELRTKLHEIVPEYVVPSDGPVSVAEEAPAGAPKT